jgi:hypothetical protein
MFRMRYPQATYSILKQYFDMLHKEDNHTISLKQGGATATTSAPPN